MEAAYHLVSYKNQAGKVKRALGLGPIHLLKAWEWQRKIIKDCFKQWLKENKVSCLSLHQVTFQRSMYKMKV
jgi:hypothetical protein